MAFICYKTLEILADITGTHPSLTVIISKLVQESNSDLHNTKMIIEAAKTSVELALENREDKAIDLITDTIEIV